MEQALEILLSLKNRLESSNEESTPLIYRRRLNIDQIGDGLDVEYVGDNYDDEFQELMKALAHPEVSPCLRALSMRGPDEGANGMNCWDISELVAGTTDFSRMEFFDIQRGRPGDHNISVISTSFAENGLLGRLLKKCPILKCIESPSAPDASFFACGERPITSLSIDAGYEHQDFIRGLADSTCFSGLRILEWGEYRETYKDVDWRTRCTPFKDYQSLINSNAFRGVIRFVWRNPICTIEEMRELKRSRPDLQIQVVHFSDHYV